MTSLRLRGMTWDHPRGFDPLIACSELYQEKTGVEIRWDKRSLQDFESYPVQELAKVYDLIVIDHPHVGQVVREGCLLPMDQPGFERDRRALLAGSVGLSYHSYLFGGRLWALPLDAASQVQAWRRDRLEAAPETWEEILGLAKAGLVILPLREPHALMCVMSLAANLGWEPGAGAGDFLPAAIGLPVLETLAELVGYINPRCFDADPIAALDQLGEDDRLACCPLVYGYVSYAHAGFRRHRVAFSDIPCLGPSGPIGTVLGGTGLAVSAKTKAPSVAMDFAYWIASAEVQSGLYAASGGQPGHGAAWSDPKVDAAADGFFTQTRATLEGAALRPRHDGYMMFQGKASNIIAAGLSARLPPSEILSRLKLLAAAINS